jgi:hypothetical protein
VTLDVTVSQLNQVSAVLFATRSHGPNGESLCLESRSGALNKAPRTYDFEHSERTRR